MNREVTGIKGCDDESKTFRSNLRRSTFELRDWTRDRICPCQHLKLESVMEKTTCVSVSVTLILALKCAETEWFGVE